MEGGQPTTSDFISQLYTLLLSVRLLRRPETGGIVFPAHGSGDSLTVNIMIDYQADPNESEQLDLIFSALADPTRRAMIGRLSQGSASIGELGSPFPITKQAVTQHVRVLERSGLLKRRVEGRVHRVSLVSRPLTHAGDWIDQIRHIWSWNLDRLEAHLEASDD